MKFLYISMLFGFFARVVCRGILVDISGARVEIVFAERFSKLYFCFVGMWPFCIDH